MLTGCLFGVIFLAGVLGRDEDGGDFFLGFSCGMGALRGVSEPNPSS